MKYISLSAVIERICKAMVNVLQERAASELGKKLRRYDAHLCKR